MVRALARKIIVRRSTSGTNTSRGPSNLGIGVLFVLLLGVFSYTRAYMPTRVYAATSSALNFQSRLYNNSGGTVADGTYSVQFKLYDALSGGTNEWTETQASLTVKNGYFSAQLGSITPFAGTINWSQEKWLTLNVNSDGEMNPRIKLTSVPYSFRSGQADTLTNGSGTLTADNLAQLAPSSVQVINSALAALRLNQTGAGLLAQWQGNGSDVFTVSKTGAVTAGTYNTNTFTSTALTFGGAGTATIQSASNQGLTVQSQGSGGLTLTSGSGTVVLGSNTLQNVSSALTLDINNAGLSTFNIVNNNGANLANLDVEGGIMAGNANAFSVNSDGDLTAVFTALNGTSTTNGAAPLGSTSLTLASAANFDIGNYVQMNSNNCGGTGINPCYAKITNKAGNTLTITPSLVWANGSTVNEYHVPELGGIDTSQALANRYGRGYFIAGVATGNGTTYYNENSIETSLASFDLLNTDVATLNIGGAATTINLGFASTNLVLPGTVDITGATLDIGTATQAGGLILQNGAAKTGTLQVGTLAANRTYTLPDADGTICLTTTCTGGGGPVDAFLKDGNTFGVLTTLGTNDVFGLAFETSGLQRLLIDAGGNVGIGTSGTPSQLLSIGGTTGNFTVNASGSVIAADLTSNGALSVLAGGASINGGLNNNSGGITSAGNITGVGTNITAAAGLTIASTGAGSIAINSASGLLALGATTLQTSDNLALDLTKATNTELTLQNSGAGIININLLDGGLNTAGTQRVTNGGALQNITGLSVISGGASITGNITLGGSSSDRLTITSQLGGASPLVFQGATDNGFATTLGITDPTANNTITLPNGSGVLLLDTRNILTAAGSGLSGGGNLSADRNLSLDLNGLTSKTNVNPNDYLAVYDATTSATRKISRSDFLQGLTGSLQYRGTWDANTNTPALADNTGTQGHTYAVSVAGTQNLGSGAVSFGVGDFVIHNGTIWEKAPSASAVTAVFGRTGAVTAQNGDYTGLQITNTAAGNLAAITVQAAINELDAEKLGNLNGLTAISQTFANDTNVTITSAGSTHTLGWAGMLAVGRGGTGANTFTPNGVVFGNGTSALQVTSAGTGGQVLIADATGVPTFTSLSGDIAVSSTGVTSIGANTITLTTDTVGNYVQNLGILTGLTSTGNTGEGSTPTLAVTYGSLANTAVQGNTGLTVAAGTNLSGGGAITLGTGGTVTLNTIANPTFATSVTTPLVASTVDLTLDSGSNKIIIAGTDTMLERTGAGSYTVDLKDNAATSLVLSNSSPGGSSVANLNLLDGAIQIAGTTVIGSDRTLQNLAGITNVGVFTTSGGIASLNAASNFATNINTGSSTGTVTIGGGTAPLVINSSAFDVTVAGALSGITTINTSGLITSVGLTAGAGLVQGTGGLTITGATSINAAANFATNINTGSSTGTVTIGGGTAPLVINSTAFDVTSAGALSGITTIGLTGAITGATATNTINGLIINAGALSGVTSIGMSGTLTLGASSTIVANTRTGITIAACTASQYVGNGVRVDDGITTAGTCRTDDSGLSDIRLKKNITSVGSVLDKMKELHIVTFDFRRDELPELNLDRGLQYGVIAQELEKIFPELVSEREDGYKEVNFQGLNFYNLKAVTELATKVDALGAADPAATTLSTGGAVRLNEAGQLQNINGLVMVSGGASVVGGLDNNNGGLKEAGAISGATSIEAETLKLNANETANLLELKKDDKGVFTVFNNGSLELRVDANNAFAVKDQEGKDYFSINTEGGLVTIGSVGSDEQAVLLVLDKKSTAGDPVGVDGASYYNAADNKFRCYQNGRWQDCLPATNAEYMLMPTTATWKQSSEKQEFPGSPRIWIDLAAAREFRLLVQMNQTGARAANCHLEYAESNNGPWQNLAQPGGYLSIDEQGTIKSEWSAITPSARKEILVRIACEGGDYDTVRQTGTTPSFGAIRLQVR